MLFATVFLTDLQCQLCRLETMYTFVATTDIVLEEKLPVRQYISPVYGHAFVIKHKGCVAAWAVVLGSFLALTNLGCPFAGSCK